MTMLQLSAREMLVTVVTLLVALAPSAWGQAGPLRAEVRAVKGAATFTTAADATPKPLKVGMAITASTNTTIRTGAESTVDLFLGASAGVVRISPNSTLSLAKLAETATGADSRVEVELGLPEGELYFNVNKLSQASRYEIKMPTGIAGIRGTKGRCLQRANPPAGAAGSPVVLLDGHLVFVHVPVGGEPKAYVMKAPPAVFFSPAEGVKEAPQDLVRGINLEIERAGKAGRGGPPFQPPGPPENRPPVEPFISPNR